MTARVGLIIPSSNRMVEQEMAPAFPPGVVAHVTRLRMTGVPSPRLRSAVAARRGSNPRACRRPLRRDCVPLHGELDGGRQVRRGSDPRHAGARRGRACDHDDHRRATRVRRARCEADRARHAIWRSHDRARGRVPAPRRLRRALGAGLRARRQRCLLRRLAAVLARACHGGGAPRCRCLFRSVARIFRSSA